MSNNVNRNLGMLIFSSKGLETKSGRKSIGKEVKKRKKEDDTILLFSHPEYMTDEVFVKACEEMSFKKENIFLYSENISSDLVLRMNYIYVTSGNTFEILDWLKKREDIFCSIRQAVLLGTNYIGSSAGAMIAGKDILLAHEFDRNFVALKDFNALGLFDGAIIPHYTKKELNNFKKNIGKDNLLRYKHLLSVSEKSCLALAAERPFK